LRWINARTTNSIQSAIMVLFRHQPAAPGAQPDTVRNLPALAERHDLVTVPAAWPAGVSQLAIAIDVCQRSNDVEVRRDWVAAARN
jgi:hypothetical protein